MNYWLDLFTGTTWNEFRLNGAHVSGFRERMRNQASKVKPGDILLCYLTGVGRWVGALEVIAPSRDETPIWKQDSFPVRFDVKPLVMLDPEHGIPMAHLEGKVSFYSGEKERGKYKGFIRMSPNLFKEIDDAKYIHALIGGAELFPVERPVDQKKLQRTPTYGVKRKRGKDMEEALVTVPESEENGLLTTDISKPAVPDDINSSSRHTEIQYNLLKIGADMGLDVWVARNDRSRVWKGNVLGEMPGMLSEVPTQFNEATNRTIELIDVLWLRGNSIIAAFEVEYTTSIYSGLLRMGDLLALQPNLDIKLYLVAPDERREKVKQEIRRPTFSLRERPLSETCGFLSFSSLMEKIDGIRKLGLASSLKPDFLESTAEYFTNAVP